MGKRKDRRQGATGRRVKLDLFNDPSGDDSSIKEEIRGNNEQTKIPNSPNSSGKKANPLFLLGQYSDDESDEEEMERSSDAKMEGSVQNGQVEENTAELNKSGNTNNIEKQSPITADPLKPDISKDQNENFIQNPITKIPKTQITADFGDWKTLIHEETNQYYYWNTVTGETSWELPAGAVPVPVTALSNYGTSSVETGTDLVGTEGPVPVQTEPSVPAERQLAEFEEGKELNGGTDFKADFDPEQLVKFGQDLLDRLLPLEGSYDKIGLIKKEIEIRVSDCKELSLYGSSLLPFWFHTETKLKLLEASVLEAEGVFSLTRTSHGSNEERETDRNPSKETESIKEEENDHTMFLPSNENLENEKHEEEIEKEKEELKIETEMDMDVEMEVEEEETPKTDTNPNYNQNNIIILNNDNEKTDLPLLEEGEILTPPPSPPGTSSVPFPPGTNPVPPPVINLVLPPVTNPVPPPVTDPVPFPPGTDPVPFPPGTDPVPFEPVPPPPETEPVPPPPPPEEEPVPVPPPPSEEPVPVPQELLVSYSSYVAPVSVPVPVPVPVQSYVGLPTYDFGTGASYRSYTQPNYYDSMAYYTVPSVPAVQASVPTQIPVPVPIEREGEIGTVVERNVKTDVTAVSKIQIPKVVKGKKRTSAVGPTMRSNKKVASMVDKWKAVSEELHEEPESAIEVLEKKRQREIEEWKANQIASGEAKDNANFVPLGGDWRERVKKRKAKEAKKEKTESSSETEKINISSVEDKKQEIKQIQETDLAKFSTGLPSGWQAYWDESSKQVYYGNVVTSETSWVRPT